MSRILRRPMFRGGSANEGIMSVPRKQYERAGSVDGFENEDELAANESLFNSGTITTKPTGLTISDSGVDLNKIDTKAEGIKQKYKALGQDIEVGSYGDLLMKEYLGNRPDPLGKFLINFGLNYMSARPRGGKFGALATAADAAKKPTEQLYADIDTDRLLKLKLMSAIGKSESKGAFEKEVNFIWEREKSKMERGEKPTFKTREEVSDYLRTSKYDSTKKETSIPEQIRNRSKEIMSSVGGAPSKTVADNIAEFEIVGINKLSKEEKAKLDLKGNYFLPSLSIRQKPNSTDFAFLKPDNSILKALEEGLNYVDPGSRSVYTYVGPNTFRLVSKY